MLADKIIIKGEMNWLGGGGVLIDMEGIMERLREYLRGM